MLKLVNDFLAIEDLAFCWF